MSPKVYRVYILRNPTGRLYIGITGDVATRAAQHNAG
jgi:predicted GIY-YIG superfamily endonuclease